MAQDSLQTKAGRLWIGTRTTVSLFGDDGQNIGRGAGGQLRLRLAERVNTEWFADLISTNLDDIAYRTDYHIGWSVLFYPTPPLQKFQPYVLAGHCFDYTRVAKSGKDGIRMSRWSAAVQGGAGVHYLPVSRLDVSLSAQYMLHLGDEITAHESNQVFILTREKEPGFEGHLLVTLSASYDLIGLW
ncbi:MAG: hypothetical protein H6585_06370 [Flavobacteriales bacterium]|nr:hypothetical protein [Flavobacteriales bacterium]MCB9447953.1 hypothetical protein [Flavobacteriales bacterium]